MLTVTLEIVYEFYVKPDTSILMHCYNSVVESKSQGWIPNGKEEDQCISHGLDVGNTKQAITSVFLFQCNKIGDMSV